jgi:hypothetical protein
MSRTRRSRRRQQEHESVARAERMRCPICQLPWATRELVELAARSRDSLAVRGRAFRGQSRRARETP